MPYKDIEDRKAYNAMKMREYNKKWRMYAIGKLGGKCARCGFDDTRALQIDHINNDGNLDPYFFKSKYGNRTLKYTTREFALYIEQHPEIYQLLCANCNILKDCEYAEETGARMKRKQGEVWQRKGGRWNKGG